MAKCSLHQGRGRPPKDCVECNRNRDLTPQEIKRIRRVTRTFGGKTTVVEAALPRQEPQVTLEDIKTPAKIHTTALMTLNGIPRTTPDRSSWVDVNGNPPKLDTEGKLLETFVTWGVTGCHETWRPGMKPEALRK